MTPRTWCSGKPSTARKGSNGCRVPLTVRRAVGRVLSLSGQLQAETRGNCDKFRERIGLHLAHDPTPVLLDGDLADSELAADLFVEQPRNHCCHYLAFAPR